MTPNSHTYRQERKLLPILFVWTVEVSSKVLSITSQSLFLLLLSRMYTSNRHRTSYRKSQNKLRILHPDLQPRRTVKNCRLLLSANRSMKTRSSRNSRKTLRRMPRNPRPGNLLILHHQGRPQAQRKLRVPRRVQRRLRLVLRRHLAWK